MSERCGFKWSAPYLHPPPSKKITYVGQECILPKGHEGNHRSQTNVTAPNNPSYVWSPDLPQWERET